jgi:two-component system sensor histidine kinase/response regulator
LSKKKILIVDDEVSVTKLLKYALERSGLYEVLTESEGPQVIVAVRKFKPDLLLLDVNMPGLTGGEIALEIKKEPDIADLPIVFLTGNVTDEEAEAGLKIAGYPALGKPINMERLIETIQKSIP